VRLQEPRRRLPREGCAIALLEFDVNDEVARKIAGFFNSGRRGRIVFHVESRRVVTAETADVMDNTPAPRTFIPTATGVYLAP